MKVDYDVSVVGAGPVGLAFAGWLAKQWPGCAHRIAVFDAKPLEVAVKDQRVLALSESTRQRLLSLGFPDQAKPIEKIHVSEKGRFGQVCMSAKELGVDALGWTVRYGDLMACLDNVVQALGVEVFRPKAVVNSATGQPGQNEQLQLETGEVVNTRLRVEAEGGVYGQSNHRDVVIDYDQCALVAEVQLNLDRLCQGGFNGAMAFERFSTSGPLALLPIASDTANYSLVWCASQDKIQQLLAAPEKEFFQEVQMLFGRRFKVLRMGKRQSFPLGLNYRKSIAKGHCVFIGNAAQILHPVAGQGLNLGLRDASVLAAALEALPKGLISVESVLQQFNATRTFDRNAVARASDLLVRVFSNDNLVLGCGRQIALNMMEGVPWLRQQFAQAMLFGFKS